VAALDLVALRAGAFSAGERLTIGLGRADLPVNVRFLAEDVVAVRREAGLEGDLFILLIVGSLMRSSRISKKGRSKKS
jgi:NAD/NADP transhydrogenase beta subunit